MSQEYYQTLHQQYPFLSAENLDLLQRQSTIVKLDKKAYWQEGNYKDKVAFIVSGAIRAFFIDEEGKEKTTIIRPAKKTIVAPGATKLLEHKTYYLQAITDTVLIEI
ncbi:MAG: hypothetical protein KTR30_24925, partial [Saprospiraceae bacterium]|nr:hypothetical protein [Saprospiraceae bacterium]